MNETVHKTVGSAISIAKGKKHALSGVPSRKAKRLIAIDDLRNDDLIRYTEDDNGTEVTPADVLIAWDGANAGTIGFGKAGYIGSTIARLRIKPGVRLFTPFLGMYLRSKFDYLRQTATGATIPHINRNALESILLPRIEFDDQIRIAHLLGKVEGLITQRKQHLQQLDDLLKSVFLEMFGDPIVNPKGFPVRRLSEFYINPKEGTKCGPFGSALKKEELVESGVPVWNMDNIGPSGRMALPFRMWITPEKYEELSAYSVQDGDIIISRAGTVGKMCVAHMHGGHAIISTNLIRLRLGTQLRPLHFVSLMQYCKGRVGRLKTGADGALTHMNTGILDSLELPYPPIELQDEFGAIAIKVESIKSRYQQNLTDLESLYRTLSQQAFKGELDLSRVPLPMAMVGAEESAVVAAPDGESEPLHVDFSQCQEYPLSDPDARRSFIERAFKTFLGEVHNGAEISLEAFWQQLSWESQDYADEDDLPLNTDDYDLVKRLVFAAIGKGEIEQIRNQVEIEGEEPMFGNAIVLNKVV